MNIEIISKNFALNLHGLSGIAANKDYAGTAFRLMGKMWQIVKTNSLKNKGLNVWVYEAGDSVFTGVELEDTSGGDYGLEFRSISLPKCAYYKHTGAYNLIKQAGQAMRDELTGRGYRVTLPYIEIYGHWTSDETKLETELLMALA
ncbi:MAG TPA: hypothetical protein VG738_15705 [Chitinophagaceae bacterium]|nr:hypothetical protein [Chitinophagaceae bacterium]